MNDLNSVLDSFEHSYKGTTWKDNKNLESVGREAIQKYMRQVWNIIVKKQ